MNRLPGILVAVALVTGGLVLQADVSLQVRGKHQARPATGSARADVLKRPGHLAPAGGTGVVFDIEKLKEEEREEGGRQLPADPDLLPGAAPKLDLPPLQRVETRDVPPPVPLAAGTFTIGRTSILAPQYSSSVSEPSVGSQGDGIFVTNNWGAARSTNNGATWTYIDPFSTFPDSPAGFTEGVCCDQRVTQDPARDLIIWFLQYLKDGAGKNGLRIAVANGQAGLAANTWTYHDIVPADFGLSAQWLDFPTMQISSNYLYVTSNVFNVDDSFHGAVIARIPLANLANNTAYTMNTFLTNSFGSITGVNGATSTMYFGARFGSNAIKVLTWPEASSSPTEATVSGLATISFSPFVCTTPDALNPCGRADTRMQTAWVTPSELGFMWHSSQDGSHAYPWTKVAILSRTTLAVISQPDIFSADSAWLYPALAVNGRGHIAGIIDRLGGSSALPQVRAIIRDDFSPEVTVSGWETYTLSASTHGTASRWGDYNGAAAHEKYPNTWLGVGHIQQGGSGDTNTGQNHAKVMNYSFYRERDDPTVLPPIVTTGAASLITASTATLNGTVNPNGLAATGFYQYGPTAAYGATTAATSVGSGNTPVSLPIAVSGLVCNTLYHFRAVGQNAGGTTNGNDVTLLTSPCPPAVTSSVAQNVSTTTADLSGNVTSAGGGTISERGFVFSGAGVNPDPLIGGPGVTKAPLAGNVGAFSTTVSSLTPSTTYAFKAYATNASATAYSPVMTFTTSDPAAAAALSAQSLVVDSTAGATVGNATPQIWYRALLFANRSYQISAWPVEHEQGADAASLTITVFSDNAGVVQANGVTGISGSLEGTANQGGDSKPFTAVIQPAVTGVYKFRVLRLSGGTVAHSVNVALRETTLFSPWTSRAAGFEGFVEMHNNTNATITVTLRAYNSAGVQQGPGLTLALQPNATDFRTATQIGVPVNVFAGIVLTHDAAFGAVSANITTLNGATGLSFDSPFTPRDGGLQGPAVR